MAFLRSTLGIAATAATLALFYRRDFVNGPYESKELDGVSSVKEFKKKLRNLKTLAGIYGSEAIFGDKLVKTKGNYVIEGTPYAKLGWFELTESGFEYSMEWSLRGPDAPATFRCTCMNAIEPLGDDKFKLVRSVHFVQLSQFYVPLWLMTNMMSTGQKTEVSEIVKFVAK